MLISAATNIGTKNINQDVFAIMYGECNENPNTYKNQAFNTECSRVVACVCDGISSCVASEKASKMSADLFTQNIFNLDNQIENEEQTNAIIDDINSQVVKFFYDNYKNTSGTTLSAVCIENSNTLCALNIGDSPIFAYRQGSLIPLYQSHSVNNSLLHYIGSAYEKASSVIYKTYLVIKPDDIILITSDGITNALDDKQIKNILANPSIQNKADELINTALPYAKDNLTAIVISNFSPKPQKHSNSFIQWKKTKPLAFKNSKSWQDELDLINMEE